MPGEPMPISPTHYQTRKRKMPQPQGESQVKTFHTNLLATLCRYRLMAVLSAIAICSTMSGCTAVLSPIDAIPVERVPKQFLATPQADKVPIDVARLRQPKPEYYLLDAGDILGVFVEGVLGNLDESPPVQFPTADSDLPPAIGYPVPVREDGTLSLPLIDPIPVRGLTISQAEQLVSRAYLDGDEPLLKGEGRIILTIMKERTYRVFVVRQDNTFFANSAQFSSQRSQRAVTDRSDQSGRGFVLQLPAYKNDVLNALATTGGMPGVNAKPEIRILRGDRVAIANRDNQMTEFYRTNEPEKFPYELVPDMPNDANTVSIPTRLKPGEVPDFKPDDIILLDGDIIYVESRDTDIYYTGGLMGGGEWLLPRDYDLDVLGAVAIAGVSVGVGNGSGRGAIANSISVPPTELLVLRKLPANRQLAIRIDLGNALNDPKQRLLVKPGDTLLLRYKPQEELINFGFATFFTYVIRQLFLPNR